MTTGKDTAKIVFSKNYDLFGVRSFVAGVEYELDRVLVEKIVKKRRDVVKSNTLHEKAIETAPVDKSMTYKKRERKKS